MATYLIYGVNKYYPSSLFGDVIFIGMDEKLSILKYYEILKSDSRNYDFVDLAKIYNGKIYKYKSCPINEFIEVFINN